MPHTLKLGDIYAVKAWCSDAEQASVNTWFYNVTAVPTSGPTDQDVASEMDALLGPLMVNIIPANVTYNGVQVQVVQQFPSSIIQPVAVQSTVHKGAGTLTGNGLPRQTCGLISWRTNQAGRKYRGRTYLPFPAVVSDNGLGVPAPGYLGSANAIATALLTYSDVAFDSVDVALGIYGRPNPASIPPIPYAFTDVATFIVEGKWATQRRRGSFGRANVSPI